MMSYIYFLLALLMALQGPLKFTKARKSGIPWPKNVTLINFFTEIGSKLNFFNQFAWPAIEKELKKIFKKKQTQKTFIPIIGYFFVAIFLGLFVFFTYSMFSEIYG